MEIFIIVALLSLAVAVQPLAAKRLPPLVHGALGSLCVALSLGLTALFAGGFVMSSPVRAALPDVDRPAPKEKASPSPAVTPKQTPDDESRFFEQPTESSDIEISTPPDGVIIPPGRPSWVEALPIREGSVHMTSVCSDPHSTQREAMLALDAKLRAATSEYIGEYLQSELAPQLIRFSLPEIKQKLLHTNGLYQEKITVSIGAMHQVHAKLEFDKEFRELLDRKWGELTATYRLAETGLVMGGVLLLLATVFGYFRLDNATRGYYTGRLQFMAAAAILAIVATGAMVSRWIHWL
ncbi:hypothetical protein [Anatilimnocola floriformis]|uniref:hypothetical protein n=1 Tax=Anatilimnocola floriformis TaxID=2948575 RepID=UPI0020C56A32|nr:hypothetical protein [Anatilimnocola floriformis]